MLRKHSRPANLVSESCFRGATSQYTVYLFLYMTIAVNHRSVIHRPRRMRWCQNLVH